ncbi:MAG: redoxin domain-containing protein [Acidobacteriota bacterium]
MSLIEPLAQWLLTFFLAAGTGVLAAMLVVGFVGSFLVRKAPRRADGAPALWTRVVSAVCAAMIWLPAAGLFLMHGPLSGVVAASHQLRSHVDAAAPPLAFRTVAGDEPQLLAELRGQVVVINLWATWCPPCIEEKPELDRLQRDFAPRGVTVITLSDESPEVLRAFLRENPTFTLAGYTEPLRGFYGVGARPTTLLIDREGIFRGYVLGARSYGFFANWIEPYL